MLLERDISPADVDFKGLSMLVYIFQRLYYEQDPDSV